MELNGALVLEFWEVMVEYLPSSKKEDVANRLVKIFADKGLDSNEFESIRGEDSHLDAAIDNVLERGDDEYEYDYDSEDYDED
jgi:hypothetical protein